MFGGHFGGTAKGEKHNHFLYSIVSLSSPQVPFDEEHRDEIQSVPTMKFLRERCSDPTAAYYACINGNDDDLYVNL